MPDLQGQPDLGGAVDDETVVGSDVEPPPALGVHRQVVPVHLHRTFRVYNTFLLFKYKKVKYFYLF